MDRSATAAGTLTSGGEMEDLGYPGASAEPHLPVMLEPALAALMPQPGKVIVDGTVGAGGHARAVLPRLLPGGILIGADRDHEALGEARKRLAAFEPHARLVHANFADLADVLREQGMNAVDGILLDLGVSSMHLDRPHRGFSFQSDGPLDMRMDQDQPWDAAALVNSSPAEDLQRIVWEFGEDRFAGRIARAIVRAREQKPIESTAELAEIIRRCVPPRSRYGRLHPATRAFQALRIAVNAELESLDRFLEQAPGLLNPGGRLVIITFHSLEDRKVKRNFAAGEKAGLYRRLARKPVRPEAEETERNRRARSAKLRAVERLP